MELELCVAVSEIFASPWKGRLGKFGATPDLTHPVLRNLDANAARAKPGTEYHIQGLCYRGYIGVYEGTMGRNMETTIVGLTCKCLRSECRCESPHRPLGNKSFSLKQN